MNFVLIIVLILVFFSVLIRIFDCIPLMVYTIRINSLCCYISRIHKLLPNQNIFQIEIILFSRNHTLKLKKKVCILERLFLSLICLWNMSWNLFFQDFTLYIWYQKTIIHKWPFRYSLLNGLNFAKGTVFYYYYYTTAHHIYYYIKN